MASGCDVDGVGDDGILGYGVESDGLEWLTGGRSYSLEVLGEQWDGVGGCWGSAGGSGRKIVIEGFLAQEYAR